MTVEDTLQKQTDQEQEALIAEMLRGAKGVELPSELAKSPVIHKGDADLPAPMTITELKSGKYFWLWETDSNEKVPCLGYMLPQKLRQRLPSGKFRFTMTDPGVLPKRGTIKCMLHLESSSRADYDELGFRTCKKSNITNRYQLEQHMKHRHPQEWEAIENARKIKEREEDRALQRLLITSVASKGTETALKVEQTVQEPSSVNSLFTCDVCNVDFGTQITMEKHKIEQHK